MTSTGRDLQVMCVDGQLAVVNKKTGGVLMYLHQQDMRIDTPTDGFVTVTVTFLTWPAV